VDIQKIEGMNAIRMWIKPHGYCSAQGLLSTGFIDGSNEIYKIDVPDAFSGTEPYILEILLEGFRRVLRRNNAKIDLVNRDFAFWPAGTYKFTVDDIMFVHDPALLEFVPKEVQ
jgi:hypothetical protein